MLLHQTAMSNMSACSALREFQPFGPHYMADARRKRHGRTFFEDERIQAQKRVKKIEDEDDDEIGDEEDSMMLQRDVKD